jgi:predicted acylesterase/phospholipase RssA
MGITIVHKSDSHRKHLSAKKALILSGGALTGGPFKVGGLKALNDYMTGFSVCDFDIYVGISSGSMIAASLIGGISPESMLKSFDGTSRHFSRLHAWHCYRPNVVEMVGRPLNFLMQAVSWLPEGMLRIAQHGGWRRGLLGSLWRFVSRPSLSAYEDLVDPLRDIIRDGDLPSLVGLLPSGLFDNGPLESYIRENIRRNRLTNDFRETLRLTGKSLYISALRLDSARQVVFGPDEETSLTISQAIQASTALPIFYKPAHLGGVDYVDGGVQETANIDTAVEKGAELIICYNPFRPYEPEEFVDGFKRRGGMGRRIAAEGVMAVINQIFRALFHTRLRVTLDKFRRSDDFKGDIILIEPRSSDAAFFALNPLSLSNRVEAARLGFESVRNSIHDHLSELTPILASYGIAMNSACVDEQYEKLVNPRASERFVQKLLEGRAAGGGRKRASRKKAARNSPAKARGRKRS